MGINTDRRPVTYKLFMESLKGLDSAVLLITLAWFSMPEDEALQAMDQWIIDAIKTPGATQDYVDGWKHLRAAWIKMTVAERAFLRKKLKDPKNILEYLPPEKLGEAMVAVLSPDELRKMMVSMAEKYPEDFWAATSQLDEEE